MAKKPPPPPTFEDLIAKGFGALAASVPTDRKENLLYRKKLRMACLSDHAKRKKIIRACKADPLFFFNAFCWVFEPRPMVVNGVELPNILPFIAWEHQVPIMQQIHAHLGHDDTGLEKSRGEGASWTIVLFAVWDWLFNDMATVGLVSKDENAVDNPDDPDSLFWKIDWQLTKLPTWMAGEKGVDYKRDRARHSLTNRRNGSSITGYAATANVASGGRKKWFGMDELAKFPRGPDKDAMASTQQITKCRLIVSTPKGADGAYYELMHEPSNMVKLRLHWSQNPTRNRGLYRMVNGRPVAEDPINNPLPESYQKMDTPILEMMDRLRTKGYKLEGVLRSPWYDRECDRPAATPQNIAQELDIDYGGSSFRIFGSDCLAKVEKTVTAAAVRGNLTFDKERVTDPVFDLIENGPFHIWMPLDAARIPPRSSFVLACDVCSGMGGSFTSNSTMEGIDTQTGEQVLEFASNTIAPADFADLAIAVAKWLHGAFLAWEHNGPGTAFTKQVIDREYSNVYYRTSQSTRKRDRGQKMGWWNSTDTREVLFETLRVAITTGAITVRSKFLLGELGQYIRKDQKIFSALTINATDDAKGATHGDRVIGLGVAAIAIKAMPTQMESAFVGGEGQSGLVPPRHTLAHREWEAEQQRLKKNGVQGWDERTLGSHVRSF